MIKEIIVVEGRDDTVAIQRAVEAETIETGGSAINDGIIEQIALAKQIRGVIIFTDPDFAGEKIRKIISSRVKGCKHAFIPAEEATKKKDIGVENASPEAIRRALRNVKTEMDKAEPSIVWEDLFTAGLLNQGDAARRRMELGKILGIGYGNGKQFLKKCNMFQISKERFQQAVQELDRRGL